MGAIIKFLFDVGEWLIDAYTKVALVGFLPVCACLFAIARDSDK